MRNILARILASQSAGMPMDYGSLYKGGMPGMEVGGKVPGRPRRVGEIARALAPTPRENPRRVSEAGQGARAPSAAAPPTRGAAPPQTSPPVPRQRPPQPMGGQNMPFPEGAPPGIGPPGRVLQWGYQPQPQQLPLTRAVDGQQMPAPGTRPSYPPRQPRVIAPVPDNAAAGGDLAGGQGDDTLAGGAGPDDLRSGIAWAAEQVGIDPVDLATAISYETAGTFDPNIPGPTTKWGRHRGLIQWGEPQAQRYLDGDFSIPSQMRGIVQYLKDTGVRPGMGLLDIYSAINAGQVGRYNASDTAAGGAPGTVRDKVEKQMDGHRRKAMALFGGDGSDVMIGAASGRSEDRLEDGAGQPAPAPDAAALLAEGGPRSDRDGRRRLAEMLANAGQGVTDAMGGGAAQIRTRGQQAPDAQQVGQQAVVQGGGNVRPISFGDVQSPEATARRRQLAEAMLQSGVSPQTIRHPLQGAAQMARAGVGAIGTIQADRADQQYRQALAQALMGGEGGGADVEALMRINPQMGARYRAQQQEMARQQAMAQQQLAIEERRRMQDRQWDVQDAEREFQRQQEMARLRADLDRPQPPSSVREFEYAQQNPEFAEYQRGMQEAGAGNINVDTGSAQEDVLNKSFIGSVIEPAIENMSAARQNRSRLATLRDSLSRTEGGAIGGLKSIGARWGIDVGPETSDIQVAQAIINQLVPGQRPPGSGQMSDRDVQLFIESLPSMWQQPGAREMLLDTMEAMADYQIAEAEIAAQFYDHGDRRRAMQQLRGLGDPMERFKTYREFATAPAPQGVDPALWSEMTPEERQMFLEAPE